MKGRNKSFHFETTGGFELGANPTSVFGKSEESILSKISQLSKPTTKKKRKKKGKRARKTSAGKRQKLRLISSVQTESTGSFHPINDADLLQQCISSEEERIRRQNRANQAVRTIVPTSRNTALLFEGGGEDTTGGENGEGGEEEEEEEETPAVPMGLDVFRNPARREKFVEGAIMNYAIAKGNKLKKRFATNENKESEERSAHSEDSGEAESAADSPFVIPSVIVDEETRRFLEGEDEDEDLELEAVEGGIEDLAQNEGDYDSEPVFDSESVYGKMNRLVKKLKILCNDCLKNHREGGRDVLVQFRLDLEEMAAQLARVLGSGDDCFMCMFGNRTHDKSPADKTNMLYKILSTYLYKDCSISAIAHTMHSYYLNEIYTEGCKQGLCLPRWSAEGVENHIRNHMLDPRIRMLLNLEKLATAREVIASQFVNFHPDQGRFSVDEKMAKLFMDFIKLELQLSKTNPKQLLGFDETLDLHPSHALIESNINVIDMLGL